MFPYGLPRASDCRAEQSEHALPRVDDREEMTMIRATIFCLAITVLVGTGTSAQTPANSLYKRLGAYDAIAAVTDDFLGRLVADPSMTKFFAGHSTDSKQRIRQHVVDFLCVATGGPCVYKGRDMKTSHAGLGITEAEWNTGVQHLVASLDKFKVPQKEKDEVLAAASGLKKDIVER
jgi:hemoglobin